MESLMHDSNTWQAGTVMDGEEQAKIISSLVSKVIWRNAGGQVGDAIQRVFVNWLAGWKSDELAASEADVLASLTLPHPSDTPSQSLERGGAMEQDIALLKSIIEAAHRASGGRESSVIARIVAVKRAIDAQARKDAIHR